jgi:hypothetical protein
MIPFKLRLPQLIDIVYGELPISKIISADLPYSDFFYQ